MVAASKHAFSFGAAGFATLAFLAIENSDTCNKNAADTTHKAGMTSPTISL
jgi:hypothetical protein